MLPFVDKILAEAAKLEKEVGARNRHEFGEWAKRAIAGGAKLAHRFTKNTFMRSIVETSWGSGEQVVPHPSDAADAELEKWIPIWGWNKVDKTLETFRKH